ncbi:MAG: hypothetical protein H6867_01440 [Rhodospirillales bacterium]|nr:hypothetical protein [Rhodospirillales bacterium]MCB9997180.1 hypothetical protein [Rhodospirillales bacterium]
MKPLRSLFRKVHNPDRQGALRLDPALIDRLTEQAVQQIDPRMRLIGSYRRQLRPAVTQMAEHLETLTGRLPPAFSCSKQDFATEPRLRGLFSATNHIHDVLHEGDILPRFFRDIHHGGAEECYTLMRVVRSEKNTFGMAMQGGMMVREVAQVAVNFRDHHFIAPQEDEQQERGAVRDHLFDEVLRHARQHRARAKVEAMHQKPPVSDIPPQQSLAILSEILKAAEQLVRLEDTDVSIDMMGIKQERPEQSKNCLRFTLPEIRIGDAAPVGLLPVKVRRSDIDVAFARKQADRIMNQMLHL